MALSSPKDDYIARAIALLREAEKSDLGSDYRMLARVVTALVVLEEGLKTREPGPGSVDLLKQVEDNFNRRHLTDLILRHMIE